MIYKHIKRCSVSIICHLSSAQFSPLRFFVTAACGLQPIRPPCPSPTPRAYSNSCPLSRWCHPTVSSSVVPFSSHLQSFPASGSFLKSQFLTAGGPSIGASASESVLPMTIQDWFPLRWTSWISLGLSRVFSNTTESLGLLKGLSRVFSNTTVQKHQFFGPHLSL